MKKYLLRAIVFCIVFISVCGFIGLQKDFISPEKQQIAELPKEPEPVILFSNMEVLPGGFFGIYVKGLTDRDKIQATTSLVLEEPSFFKHLEGKLAIVGVTCRTKAGDYQYKVQVLRDGVTVASKEEILRVKTKEFEKQYLKVSATQKNQRSDENFNEDKVHTDRAKAVPSEKPLWEGTFLKPVEGRISTQFGMIRYINKEESGRHSGLDISAAKGTPVKAANTGVVKLSMMLKVTGNTIIIDHGCNLYSSYAHLDKLLVKDGDTVKKGDIIGEVGTTGFSTGPHLHWTTTIGNVYISPESLMEEDPIGFINGSPTN